MFRFVTRLVIFGVCAVALVACGSSSDDEVTGITESSSEETNQSDTSGSSDSESSSTAGESDEVVEEESDEVVEEESDEVIEESDEVIEESDEPEIIEVEADPQIEEETAEIDEGMTPAEQEALIESILFDTYLWGTATAFKTTQLQEILGVTTDGSYGAATRLAHLVALQERGLSTDGVPEEQTVPGSPTDLTVVANTERFTVDWNPPLDNGGSEIFMYSVQSDQLPNAMCNRSAVDGVRQGDQADPCIFDAAVGVVEGVNYTFYVTAENSVGISPPVYAQPIALEPSTQTITMNLNSEGCSSADELITENGITVDFEVAPQWGYFNDNAITGTVDGTCGYENAIWQYDAQDDIEFGFTNNANYSCLRLSQISIRAWFNGPFPQDYGTLQLDTVILHLLKNGNIVDSIYTGISIAAGTAGTGSPVGVTVPISNQTCDITGMYVETVQTGDCAGVGPGCDPFHFFYDNLIFTADA
jgi:hypothetical protein